MTDAGGEVYRHAVGMLVEADAAEHAVRRRLAEPAGTVRLTCSIAIAQFVLAHLLPRFMTAFPKVQIVQHASNRAVDLVEEGFDLAIRAHVDPLPDSSLIRRRLVRSPRYLVAAGAYLQRCGEPMRPEDLAAHVCLAMGDGAGRTMWRCRMEGEDETAVPISPRLFTDDLVTLKTAALEGIGIANLPAFMCRQDIAQGQLERVLPEWSPGGAQITLLTPFRRDLLPPCAP